MNHCRLYCSSYKTIYGCQYTITLRFAGGLNDVVFGLILAVTFLLAMFGRYLFKGTGKRVTASRTKWTNMVTVCRKADVLVYRNSAKSYPAYLAAELPVGDLHNF